MSFAELDAWLELYEWANETPDKDEGGTQLSASHGERAFFHL